MSYCRHSASASKSLRSGSPCWKPGGSAARTSQRPDERRAEMVNVTANAIRVGGQIFRLFRQAGTDAWVYAVGEARPHSVWKFLRPVVSLIHRPLIRR